MGIRKCRREQQSWFGIRKCSLINKHTYANIYLLLMRHTWLFDIKIDPLTFWVVILLVKLFALYRITYQWQYPQNQFGITISTHTHTYTNTAKVCVRMLMRRTHTHICKYIWNCLWVNINGGTGNNVCHVCGQKLCWPKKKNKKIVKIKQLSKKQTQSMQLRDMIKNN